MRGGWIFFVARRYLAGGRRKKRPQAASVLAAIGIGAGALALTVIIAVMNGFQLGFIESILEISSYYIRVDNFPPERAGAINDISAIKGVTSVTPFREVKSIIRGTRNRQSVAAARGLPPQALEIDAGLARKLEFEAGSFDIADTHSILLGAELAAKLAVSLGEEVSLFSINSGSLASLASNSSDSEGGESEMFTVTGIFRSGFYEYDLGWAFININGAGVFDAIGAGEENAAEASPVTLGIKLDNRWHDLRALAAIKEAVSASLPPSEAAKTRVSSWRDYNKSFFGALRTEKTLMFFLVGLIFVVVSLNIFQAQRRAVLERREEIGLLRAVGASTFAIRSIFACDGLIIGLTGSTLGMAAGLAIATHISGFFTLLETLVNAVISFFNFTASLFIRGGVGAGEFSVFPPAVFYITEIPARVIPHEALLTFLAGVFSALLAAALAGGKAAAVKPAEALRCE